jgi:hypothetical protein
MQTRPSHFSEAMEISATGEPLYPWEIARETYSYLIEALHEVMSLPPIPLAKGAAWRSALTGLDFRWVDDESVHGKLCHHIEGASTDGSLKLNYWWSPESGVLEQVAYEGSYSNSGAVHETARMELESRTRGERLENWLASADTRLGALQAILLTPSLPISAEQLASVLAPDDLGQDGLAHDDPAAQALALAIASRRRIEVPAPILSKLRQSTSAQTQLVQTQLRLLAELSSSSKSGSPPASVDECHRALPLKSPPVKFGTLLETTPASKDKDNSQISYLLRIPLSYREDRPSPLLVYLSGGAGFAMDGMYSAEAAVSRTDYVVLYRILVDTRSRSPLRCRLQRRCATLQRRSRSNLPDRLQQRGNWRTLLRRALAAAFRRGRFAHGRRPMQRTSQGRPAESQEPPAIFRSRRE